MPLFRRPSGHPRPVEEVAKDLVGCFLISYESKVVLRIVETEAYPEREEIYRYKFPSQSPDFRSPAGTLVTSPIPLGQRIILITAGDDNSGDLVLLRTCAPVHGTSEIARRRSITLPISEYELNNMISGPLQVTSALAPDLDRDRNLLQASRGLHLLQRDPEPLSLLEGPRILPSDTHRVKFSTMTGFDSRFRFAFDCPQRLISRRSLRPVV